MLKNLKKNQILKKFLKMSIFAYYFQIIFLTNYLSDKIERNVPPQSTAAKNGGGGRAPKAPRQGRSQHGARGQLPPPILGVAPPQSGLAPATVVSLRLTMGQLRLEKCIKTKTIQYK